MNETKFADSSEEESLGRFAQYIDYTKEMPFPNMRFECRGPGPAGNLTKESVAFPTYSQETGTGDHRHIRLGRDIFLTFMQRNSV